MCGRQNKKAKLKEGKDEGHLSLLHGDSCVGDPKTVMMMKVLLKDILNIK